MANYAAAKNGLFELLDEDGTAIVNIDDQAAEMMISATKAKNLIRVSTQSAPGADLSAEVRCERADGTEIELTGLGFDGGGDGSASRSTQRSNVLCSVCSARSHGPADLARIASSSGSTRRPEPVEDPADEVKVFVDYAHTDDALCQVLTAMRPAVPEGAQLHVLFGWGVTAIAKRPRMAQVATAQRTGSW